jgi:membrane-bound lytic murein transglycosylase D
MLTVRGPRRWVLPTVGALAILSAACSARRPAAVAVVAASPAPVASAVAAVTPPAAPPAAPTPVTDPVRDLLAASTGHLEEGQRRIRDGQLESARIHFHRALEVLMTSPQGARWDPRVREQFDRLVAQVSAQEALALAAAPQGDGFNERPSEPAALEALLDASRADPPASPETRQAVEADVAATTYDIDVPLTPRVLAFVEMYTANPRMRSFLEEGLSRGAKYLPMVQAVFRAEGLPIDLAYVPLVESAFKPSALSRAKARGIWQFMPGTGIEQGLKRDWYIDERADPEKATRAAAKYLQQLYGRFGDWHLALASYNGGPGRVQRALRRSGKTDFWALRETTRYLPRETRDYVPLILAAVIVARNPARYGLSIRVDEPLAVETVTLENPVDVRLVAEWAETPVETIQDLNPELRRWTTPLRGSPYELKVPAGTTDRILAGLSSTSAEELAPLSRHTVRKGETLRSIARTLNVSQTDLTEANYLPRGARVSSGQELIVPRQPTLLLAARSRDAAPGADSSAEPVVVAVASVSPDERLVAPSAAPPRAAASRSPTPRMPSATRVHRVRRGDTLISIARLYRTTVASLTQWNQLRGTTIRIGQRLTVLGSRALSTN